MTVRFFTDADGFYLGSFWEGTQPPAGAVECGEGLDGHQLVLGVWQPVTQTDWAAHFKPQETLEQWRAEAKAEKWQLKTVMGPEAWAVVQAIHDDPTIILGDGGNWDISAQIWAVKTAIADVQTVPRVSELVEMLRYALGWSNEFADDIFRQAAAVRR
jgi:hypothetical protein